MTRQSVCIRAFCMVLAASGCSTSATEPPASLIGRFDLFWRTFDAQYSSVVVGRWNSTQFGNAELDAVVDHFRDAPSMIIDVRPNSGGSEGGGTGNPAEFALGDGWKFTVSRWIEWTADRRVIEWNGIPPDAYVPWDEASVLAGWDPILEEALARLSSASSGRPDIVRSPR